MERTWPLKTEPHPPLHPYFPVCGFWSEACGPGGLLPWSGLAGCSGVLAGGAFQLFIWITAWQITVTHSALTFTYEIIYEAEREQFPCLYVLLILAVDGFLYDMIG